MNIKKIVLFGLSIAVFSVSNSAAVLGSETLPVISVSDNISQDTTWEAGYVYVIQNNITVETNATLTLDPEVIVKFSNNSSVLGVNGALQVNGTSSNKVYLTSIKDDSVGGDTNGDGDTTLPSKGDWANIIFGSNSVGNFNHAVVRYGSGSFGYSGIINNSGGTVNLLNTDISYSSGAYQASGNFSITDSNIHDNFTGFEQIGGSSTITGSEFNINVWPVVIKGGTSDISGNNIQNNDQRIFIDGVGSSADVYSNTITIPSTGIGGIYISEGELNLDGNTFINNNSSSDAYPVNVRYPAVFTHSGNTFSGPGKQVIYYNGTIESDITWNQQASPYIIGSLKVGAGVKLTINPGTVIKFRERTPLIIQGTLEVNGSSTDKVYFTSIKDDTVGGDTNRDGSATLPQDQDWNVIKFENSSIGNFNHAVVRYGGWQEDRGIFNLGGTVDITDSEVGYSGSVYQHSGSMFITNSHIHNSGSGNSGFYQGDGTSIISGSEFDNNTGNSGGNTSGIFINGGSSEISGSSMHDNLIGVLVRNSSVTLTSNEIRNNDYGLRYSSGELSTSLNSFTGNSVYGVHNESTTSIDVSNSWWGNSSGPEHSTNSSGTGDEVSDYATFTPWLTCITQDGWSVSPCDPVIIVPGMLGSWWPKAVPGLSADSLAIDPILHTYDNLVNGFVENGYLLGKDIFTFPYDWRKDNRLTAVELRDKIADIKDICECGKVDIVAHSMGGLVTRYYIQSNLYQDDIDQLVLLGTPNKGIPKVYLAWEAGEMTPSGIFDIPGGLRESLLSVLAYAEGFGFDRFNYIRNKPLLSVKQLLPSYDYLKDADTLELLSYPGGYPENSFLSVSDSEGGLNSPAGLQAFEESGIRIINIIGSVANKTINTIRITEDSSKLPLWEHGYPEDYNSLFGDHGLEFGGGDDTVPLSSAALNLSNVEEITVERAHGDLPKKEWELVFEELTGINPTPISSPILPVKWLVLSVYSPVDIQVIDPLGKKVGKDFSDEVDINEIPLAYYSGFEHPNMEFVVIPDPEEGEYTILTKGTDEGSYKIAVDYFDEEDELNISSDFTANTGVGSDQELLFDLSPTISEEIIIEPADTTSPTTTISLSGTVGNNGWHTSDVVITLSANDNSGGVGVLETEYSLDGGATWDTYSSPFTISTESDNNIVQYRSEDYVGNVENIQSQTVKIDKTPPEAGMYFDNTLQELVVDGVDNLTNTTTTTTGATDFLVEDESGRNIKLIFTNTTPTIAGSASALDIELISLQYDGGATITPPATNLTYLSDNITGVFEQYIEVYGQFTISATHNPITNETVILKDVGGTITNDVAPGFILVQLTTDNGQLSFEY